MTFIDRKYRLSGTRGSLGLRCNAEGLWLAGVSLLTKREGTFKPRDAPEIEALMKAAYGRDGGAAALYPSLGVIASALNRGDLSLAMIAALLMKLPDLVWDEAARLAKAEDLLKFDPNEPRDPDGRWTTGPSGSQSREREPPESPKDPHVDLPKIVDGQHPELEDVYDLLGPTEFSEKVIQFGEHLGRDAPNFTANEREEAFLEYAFLQDRLTYWLGYGHKPPNSQDYLLSAALTLYQGAVTGGLINVGAAHGGLPLSMIDVAGAALGDENGLQNPGLRRPGTGSPLDAVPFVPPRSNQRLGELGGVVENKHIGISWNGGIAGQGFPWSAFLGRLLPAFALLKRFATGFDRYNEGWREAISDKTMNTLSRSYTKTPARVYRKLKRYVDDIADYEPRTKYDLDPADIDRKTIQLAVPEFTSADQWAQIMRAIVYAKTRKVSVIVTRVRNNFPK